MTDDPYFDLTTYDGRRRACRAIERSDLPPELQKVLLELMVAGEFPKRKGRPPKPVHIQVRDDLRALARRGPGSSTLDAGDRDRLYRPNRKRATPKK